MRLIKLLLRYWLKRSISQKGVGAPVLVSRGGIVLDGNHRVMLARELGLLVPIVRLDADIEYIDPNKLKTYFDYAEAALDA